MWIRKKHRFVRRVALAFAVAALAAPAAQGYVANEGGSSTTPLHSRPDDRGVRVGGPAQSQLTRPDDRASRVGGPVEAQPQLVGSDTGGIDWRDAGIGAALAAALAAFGVSAVKFSGRMKPAES